MKKYILLFIIVLFPLAAMAQGQLSGRVSTSDGQPVAGATVLIKDTFNGTVTNSQGEYTLSNVPGDAVAVYSMLGYETQEIAVGGRSMVNVVFEESAAMIDDVVVIGYGTVRRQDLTSSIATVSGDKLTGFSTGNPMNALQGQAAGIQISQGGSPGTAPRVIIRGITTVNSSEPLYVVDGVPLTPGSNINQINSEDIKAIDVLKDASASAIYGTRASNGVILITTKRGIQNGDGRTHFQVHTSIGFQTLDKPSVADAATYEKAFKARYTNDGTDWSSAWYANGFTKDNLTAADNTDWWDQTINKLALQQDHSVSFQGGTEKFAFSGSVGYFRQESQTDYGYWDRFTARFNIDYKLNDMVKMGVDFNPRWESWDNTNAPIYAAMSMDPTTPVYRAIDEWDVENPYNNYARAYHNQEWNPVASVNRSDDHTDEYGIIMNPYLQIEPVKGLIVRSQFGVNGRFSVRDIFSPEFYIDNLEQNENTKADRRIYTNVDWTWTNTATYMKTFAEKHNLNAMLGFTMEQFGEYYLTGSQEGVPSNYKDLRYVSAGTKNPAVSGTNVYSSLISYLGRVMYNYDQKYYITGAVRVDGSSKFPSGNKYATFPSVSAAWRITGEEFMADQNVVSELKLRGGWGRVGNQDIDNSAYLYTLNTTNYVFGGSRVVGTEIAQVGNPDLKWEIVEDWTIGLDANFLANRLTFNADYFQKLSKDMLYKKANPLILGYPMWNGEMWENVGSIKSNGVELSLNWADRAGDFYYNIGANLTHIRTIAKKFNGEAYIDAVEFYGGNNIIRNAEGGQLSRFYGYVVDGIFQSWEEVLNYTDNNGNLLQPDAQPGDFRYRDLNGDGTIDNEDRTYLGNAFPKVSLGLNFNFAYKGFDLTANFYGTFGNNIYNSTLRGFYSGDGGQNVYADAYDKAWSWENTSGTNPRFSVEDANGNYKKVSSFFVENGSYMRLKLLQLGYTIPKSKTGNLGIRVYASAQNLFTITGYSGFDPEVALQSGSVMETGVDNILYPNPRVFMFGLNLTF